MPRCGVFDSSLVPRGFPRRPASGYCSFHSWGLGGPGGRLPLGQLGTRMLRRVGRTVLAVALASAAPIAVATARADTLDGALVEAYKTNPALNSQRASVRSIDENVSQALAGYRPRAAVTATGGEQSISTTTKVP